MKTTWSSRLALALVIALSLPAQALAISKADLHAVQYESTFSDDQTYETCSLGAAAATGTLPTIIPEPYNGAFTEAGTKKNVEPALLAGLFTEENFTGIDPANLAAKWQSFLTSHPDPNSGWPSSSAGAKGPFQFLQSTWDGAYNNGYGDDGDGDGVKDINNLRDAALAAANYAAANGATVGNDAKYQDFIFNYNHAQWYVDQVMVYVNYYRTGATAAGAGGTAATAAATNNTDTNCASTGASATCNNADGTAATGNLKLLCEAEKFDPFGYTQSQTLPGKGGHMDPEAFMAEFNSTGGYTQAFRPLLDCSGLINVAAWNAYGIKLHPMNTASMGAGQGAFAQYFKQLPSVSDAKPGDVLWKTGHTGIATNDGGSMNFAAHTDGVAAANQISGPGPESDWTRAYRYIGPGSDGE